MPLPSPKKNESKQNFLDRCMADKITNRDYPDRFQRFAVCNSQWAQGHKKEYDDYNDG